MECLIWINQAEYRQDNGDAQGYYLNREFPGEKQKHGSDDNRES